MSFRLVPKSATLNDLERRNGRYIASLNLLNTCVRTHNRVDLWLNLCTSQLYFVVRAQCRRKESSRSLSHLLMSFLYVYFSADCVACKWRYPLFVTLILNELSRMRNAANGLHNGDRLLQNFCHENNEMNAELAVGQRGH